MEPQTEGYVRVSPGNRAAAGRIGSVHRLFLGTTSVYTGYSAPGSEVASEAHQQSTGAHNVLSAREVLSASDDGWIDIFLCHRSLRAASNRSCTAISNAARPVRSSTLTASAQSVQRLPGIPRTPTFGLSRLVQEHSEVLAVFQTSTRTRHEEIHDTSSTPSAINSSDLPNKKNAGAPMSHQNSDLPSNRADERYTRRGLPPSRIGLHAPFAEASVCSGYPIPAHSRRKLF